MRKTTLLVAMGCVFSTATFAQQAKLDATQDQGRKLFTQSCGVCHTKPSITAGLYGPALSKETLGGDEGAMVDFISLGTEKMPGFRHMFEKSQIQSIAAYLKTIPAPAPAPAK